MLKTCNTVKVARMNMYTALVKFTLGLMYFEVFKWRPYSLTQISLVVVVVLLFSFFFFLFVCVKAIIIN